MTWVEPKTWVPGEIPTATDFNTHIRDALNAVFPIGAYLLRAANYQTVETAVEGRWLQCNGVAVSRVTYSELFALLNAVSPALPFGAGDGSTTFNLPDLRGRTPYGEGEHANVDVMGDSEGQLIANRGPHHHHEWTRGNGNSVGGFLGNFPSFDVVGSQVSTGGGAALDKAAYLVAGSWFIKYH
jgi:microcystin-dependent protein